MEKFVRKLTTAITFLIVYAFGAYSYLSYKGFEYKNGTFTLIKPAAAESVMSEQNDSIATPLDNNLNIADGIPTILGKDDATLTLYEFSSLGCSHCADFHLNILPRLQKEYIDTGKLRVVFVNFPLEKNSMRGAMLFECLPEDYRHNFLNMAFSKQREWMLSFNPEKVLSSYALASGLNKTATEDCLKNDKLAQEIITRRQEAINQLKIQGTPAFVISGNDKKEIIYGVPAFDALKAYIDQRLEN